MNRLLLWDIFVPSPDILNLTFSSDVTVLFFSYKNNITSSAKLKKVLSLFFLHQARHLRCQYLHVVEFHFLGGSSGRFCPLEARRRGGLIEANLL